MNQPAAQFDLEDTGEVPVSFGSLAFLSGGGEVGARLRAIDWSKTSLGPPEHWPQSLKTIVRLILDSRYAMWMAWGPELTFFCNDAYLPTVGIKRDWVLGARSDAVWEEIWPDIGPRIDHVLHTGQATWDEGLLLYLERSGYPEETYHTFSYSPVYDDASRVAGMLCVVTEVTDRVIGERRLRALRDLAKRTIGAQSVRENCQRAIEVLSRYPLDLPFVALYLIEPEQQQAELAAMTHAISGQYIPHRIELHEFDTLWPITTTLSSQTPQRLDNLPGRGIEIPSGHADELIQQAILLPIKAAGGQEPVGLVIAGTSPRRAFDEPYTNFLELVMAQISSAIADAEAYERERRRAEALAEIDRAKTTFFSNVSHEFRTPLTLMLGPLEDALRKASTPNDVRAQLEVAHRNSLRLLKLVNSLLDFSRIEAGRVHAQFEPVDLGLLTRDLASSFRSATERAGLMLNVEATTLDERVFVDREMWEKIVLNLMSNAFKFTLEGQISVRVRREGICAVLEVEDSGVGIAEENLARIFERFHRVEGTRGRTHEGSGIGLALVQELVKAHGGSIEVASELGQGTVFSVYIPLGSAHLPRESIRAERGQPSTAIGAAAFVQEALRWLPDATGVHRALRDRAPVVSDQRFATTFGARIVLADDNADMRAYVRDLLQPMYEVEAVVDGQQALDAIRRERPALLLCDVMMPNLDGFGLLRLLRSDPKLRSLPIVILSARAGEEARVEGLDAGADDYLIKPFSARELLARVGALLELTQARHAAEERMRLAIEGTRMGTWDMDLKTGRAYWSRTHFEALGYEPDPEGLATCDMWHARIHPDDRNRVETAFREAQQARGMYEIEYRITRADSGAVHWLASYGRFLESSGQRSVGVFLDITERKRAELALRTSEQRFRATFETAALGIALVSTEGRWLLVNDRLCAIVGYTREELLAITFADVTHPDDLAADWAQAKALLAGSISNYTMEKRYLRKNGSPVWVNLTVALVRDPHGAPEYFISALEDISQRKIFEEALAERERRFVALANAMPQLVWVSRPDGTNEFWNRGWYAYTGMSAADSRSAEGWLMALHADDRERVRARWAQSLQNGTSYETNFRLRRHDGVYRWFLARASADRDLQGLILRWFGTCTDIDAAKRTEEHLRATEVALRDADHRKDVFMATLAHELRNPLAPIRTAAAVLGAAHSDPTDLAASRAIITRQVKHMAWLLDDLLDISRITRGTLELRKELVELPAVIEAAVETAQPLIASKRHALTLDLSPQNGPIEADPVRLTQIVANLLTNAAKYTDAGGRITLAVRFEPHNAIISVRDTGIGLEPGMQSKVFEMFSQVQTESQRAEGGLGIGLSLVKGLIELHGGFVEAHSEGLGQGSEFRVMLPRPVPLLPSIPASPAAPEAPAPNAKRRIVIADDNRDGVESLGMLLRLSGHEVYLAHSGTQALDIAEQRRPEILVLDIGMPDLTGYEVARRIRQQSWGARIKLIAVTGWGQEDDKRQAQAAGFDHHLTKPVDPDELEALFAREGAESAAG